MNPRPILLLLLCWPLLSYAVDQEKTKANKDTAANQVEYKFSPIVRTQDSVSDRKTPDDSTTDSDNRNDNTPDWWMVVLTVGLLFIGWYQLWLAKDTSKRELRAYVFMEGGEVPNNAGFFTRLFLRNNGQTPAYNVVVLISEDIFPTGEQDVFPIIPPRNPPSTVLQPQEYRAFTFPAPNPTDRRLVELGKSMYFIWGEVLYTDAFGTDHHTKFRFYVGGDGRVRLYHEGNEADNNPPHGFFKQIRAKWRAWTEA
jgi:hypothetical protein